MGPPFRVQVMSFLFNVQEQEKSHFDAVKGEDLEFFFSDM